MLVKATVEFRAELIFHKEKEESVSGIGKLGNVNWEHAIMFSLVVVWAWFFGAGLGE